MSKVIDTEVLVVGAGPAGASTAAFLARWGVPTLMISRYRGAAHTPRAHIVNQRTMEIMRDAGLERECLDVATDGRHIANTFWLESMAGAEIARNWAWGNDPARQGDYLTASPCHFVDLTQSKMEPILVEQATRLGGHMRFGWELLDFAQDADGVDARIKDRLTDAEVTVRAKYLVGADGARSRIVEKLGIPLVGEETPGQTYAVECDIDLAPYTVNRHASFYNVIQPGSSEWSPFSMFRVVRTWDRWLVGMSRPIGYQGPDATEDDIIQRIRQGVGVPDLPVRIRSSLQAQGNSIYADYMSVGRVLCMGDAIHRHSPARALGSNTCVQDGFNLAWKLALVLQGKAGPALLDTFNEERHPVAKQIVHAASGSLMDFMQITDFLGGGIFQARTLAQVAEVLDTAEGREALRELLSRQRYNGHGHGLEMTRSYRSAAVVDDGAPEPTPTRDPDLYYEPSTRPGSSLPHAWLVRREDGPLISTQDLAGKDAFHIFTGHGGEAWRDAARAVAEALGVAIGVTLIGPGLDYLDPYYDWWKLRGVGDDGCVLARPDLMVGWRSAAMPDDPKAALSQVMGQILCLPANGLPRSPIPTTTTSGEKW